jgi:hypothetical protein
MSRGISDRYRAMIVQHIAYHARLEFIAETDHEQGTLAMRRLDARHIAGNKAITPSHDSLMLAMRDIFRIVFIARWWR